MIFIGTLRKNFEVREEKFKMEDLSKKTVPQLKKLAKEIGVKGYSTMTKHLLVAYCQATLEIPNKPTPIGTQRSPFGIGS